VVVRREGAVAEVGERGHRRGEPCQVVFQLGVRGEPVGEARETASQLISLSWSMAVSPSASE
jgi:hypothetical protein